MKTETQKKVIVYDATYGAGPTFYLAEAEIGKKMVRVHGHNQRLSGFTYAIATKELAQEAKEIMDARKELDKRASAFRKKLKELQPA